MLMGQTEERRPTKGFIREDMLCAFACFSFFPLFLFFLLTNRSFWIRLSVLLNCLLRRCGVFTREPFKRFFSGTANGQRLMCWSLKTKCLPFQLRAEPPTLARLLGCVSPLCLFYISCSPSCLPDHIENRNHLGVKPYEKVTDSLPKTCLVVV